VAQGIKSISRELRAGAATLRRLAGVTSSRRIMRMAETMATAVQAGGKIVACGNGGSAADAQHFITELVVRLQEDRAPIRALALTTNTSLLTAAANDLGYKQIFARQIAAQVDADDVVVIISTSGNSSNVLAAARAATKIGATVLGLTGGGGGKLKPLCHHWLGVVASNTQHIQEGHIAVLHVLCMQMENILFGTGVKRGGAR